MMKNKLSFEFEKKNKKLRLFSNFIIFFISLYVKIENGLLEGFNKNNKNTQFFYLLSAGVAAAAGGSNISNINCEFPLLTLILQFNSVIPPGTRFLYSFVLQPAIALLFFDAALSGPTLHSIFWNK